MTDSPSFWLETTRDDIDAGAMHVHRFVGREAVGQPFRYDIDVVIDASDGQPDPQHWLGARMCLLMRPYATHPLRRVWGMIVEVQDAAADEDDRRGYRLGLVPRAERLRLVHTQDVYTDMSVPNIVALKAGRVGLSAAFDRRLRDEYAVRPFVVQYRETDLAFVSRLAEHLGISLVIDQRDDGDVLTLVDHPGGFSQREEAVVYTTTSGGPGYSLQRQRRLLPRHYGVQDYNPSTPDVEVVAIVEIAGGYAGGVAEYAPHVASAEEAEQLATIRAEELAGRGHAYTGVAGAPQLAAGLRVHFTGHPRYGDPWLLITELEARGSQPGPGTDRADEPHYQCTFTARPASHPFRPPRLTPKPRISGVVPGVVAPNAEGNLQAPARIDDSGRYSIRLLFDTAERPELRASAPVRMAQPFAGAGDGMHFPLRPGVEVALAFVDGDPDRPLIVGALPNAVTPSPVTARNAVVNRIQTETGIVVEFGDVMPNS